ELVLGVKPRGVNHGDARVGALAVAVHAPEALDHALESGQVADHVIGGDVDAHFAGGRANQKDGAGHGGDARITALFWQEPHEYPVVFREGVTFQAAHRAVELLDTALRHAIFLVRQAT